MRLTSEELQELTNYLISILKRKRFSVNVNRHGVILYTEKFGIRCCPAILNSKEDGKQGYAYIQLAINPYNEKDLGSYYKPRTNKSTHAVFEENDSIDKYAGKAVHIDMHNYKQVIDNFVNDLNKDYKRVVSKNEDLDFENSSSEGKCLYRPNYKVWLISKDNQTLKAILTSIVHELEQYENRPDYLNGWLVGLDKYDENGRLDIALGSDSAEFPHSYHPVVYIGGELKQKVLDAITKWRVDNPSQSLVESLVKIKDTGTVFDGMSGTVEKEDDEKVTVMVDFNSEHKVRNIFKKEQVEILEE